VSETQLVAAHAEALGAGGVGAGAGAPAPLEQYIGRDAKLPVHVARSAIAMHLPVPLHHPHASTRAQLAQSVKLGQSYPVRPQSDVELAVAFDGHEWSNRLMHRCDAAHH
jgi:hypothetical protein